MPNPNPQLPPAFSERLAQFPTELRVGQWLPTLHTGRATTFRANTLKTDSAQLLRELETSGLHPQRVAGVPEAFRVDDDSRRQLTESPAAGEGRLFIQNASSMVPPLVLDPQPGEEILDLAAAPGGKCIHLAGLMENHGRIAAVESVRNRFFRLRRNIELYGAEIVDTYLRDGASVWRACPEQFDSVLLDAPCSGEGRFSTLEPKSFAYWSEKKIAEMSRKQRRLFYSAVRSLKTGGRLVYCTCTFAPEENELIVDRALRQFAGCLEIEEIGIRHANGVAGLTSWRDKPLNPSLEATLRILPDGVMEGFYVACLRKVASTADLQRSSNAAPA